LTAAHVINEALVKRPIKESDIQAGWLKPEQFEKRLFLLPGQGLVYGTGPAATAPADRGYLVLKKSDNPLRYGEFETLADIATLQVSFLPNQEAISTLPVRLSGRLPQVGETVLAVGFPELVCEPVDDLNHFISEGMYGAYGQVIKLHPKGTDRTNPTPVIEVEANWRNGMSGGPVFNQKGEVVGIVSRALDPDGDNMGHGYAACFQLMPWIRRFLPTVDPWNPGWRLGWGVMKSSPLYLAGFFGSEGMAHEYAKTLGADYEVIFGSNRIGTDKCRFPIGN
jgi:serine protease Do